MTIDNDVKITCTLSGSLNRGNDVAFTSKQFDEKTALIPIHKEGLFFGTGKMNTETCMEYMSRPKQVVYESALQSFMQQLLKEQTRSSSKSIAEAAILIDSMLLLPQQQSQHFDMDAIPELQESYTTTDLTTTDSDDDNHGDHQYDSTSTLDENDDENTKYSNLPLLIDMSQEMRSFM